MAVIGSVANVGVLPVPMLPVSNWGLAAPNYRTVFRQTTERLLRGIGYFDIMFAIWQKNYRKPRHAAYAFLTEDRRRRTEDLGHWTLDGCGIAEFMVTYRRFQKREK